MREKDEEIEVYKSGMEQALMELEELKLVCSTVKDQLKRTQLTVNRARETPIMHLIRKLTAYY